MLPAGPLREPVAAGAARCRAAVLIGPDAAWRAGGAARGTAGPARRAGRREPSLAGVRVLAFAGIGRPEKFFASAAQAGAELVERRAFPDHHRYSRRAIEALLDRAAQRGAAPLTTAKDAARLPPDLRPRVRVLGVRLAWEDPGAIEALLREVVP